MSEVKSNMYLNSKFKNSVINLLLKNDDFIKVVNPKPHTDCNELDDIDLMLGGDYNINGTEVHEPGYIFDYNFVTDVTQDRGTYIFVESDVSFVTSGSYIAFNIYVCIFADKKSIRLSDRTEPTVEEVSDMGYFCGRFGNRVDVLCDIADSILCKNNEVGGLISMTPAERDHLSIFQPNYYYYGKTLKYTVKIYSEGGNACGL